MQRGVLGYSNADLVVKFSGWEPGCAPDVAQACLSALKQRILSDKQLPGIPLSLSLSLSLSKSYDFSKREKTKVFQCFRGSQLTCCMHRDMVDFMLN